MSLPNENRILDQLRFTVAANQREKPLGITWGGPVLVQTYSTDANFEVREVDVVPIQNQDKYYIGPQTTGGSATFPHVAQSFTFYTRSSDLQLVARPNPIHSAAAEYLVFFQPSAFIQPASENSYPLPEEFVGLAEVRVAQTFLPMLFERNDKNEITNGEEVSLLGTALSKQEQQYLDTFEEKKSLTIPQQSGMRIGFSNYYSDGYDEGW